MTARINFNPKSKRPFQIVKNGRWVSFSTEAKAVAAFEANQAEMKARHEQWISDVRYAQKQSEQAAEGKFRGH